MVAWLSKPALSGHYCAASWALLLPQLYLWTVQRLLRFCTSAFVRTHMWQQPKERELRPTESMPPSHLPLTDGLSTAHILVMIQYHWMFMFARSRISEYKMPANLQSAKAAVALSALRNCFALLCHAIRDCTGDRIEQSCCGGMGQRSTYISCVLCCTAQAVTAAGNVHRVSNTQQHRHQQYTDGFLPQRALLPGQSFSSV